MPAEIYGQKDLRSLGSIRCHLPAVQPAGGLADGIFTSLVARAFTATGDETECSGTVGYIAFLRPIPVYAVHEVTMRSVMAGSMALLFLASAHANETIKFNCEISHIQGFKPDGTALQASAGDMSAKYVVAIQNDAIRAEYKSGNRKEMVVYRVLMHNSTDFIGAMAQAKPSDAAIAISKEPNPAYGLYPGGLTASAGGSMKLISLMCAKAQ